MLQLAADSATYLQHILSEERMWWTFVSTGYFVIAVYSAITPRKDYPAWFWMTYLLISVSILFRISANYRWNEPVTIFAEYLLIVAATLLGAIIFKAVSVYAEHRDDIDPIIFGDLATGNDNEDEDDEDRR